MKLKLVILAASIVVLASCGSYRATDQSTIIVEVPDGTRTAFVTQYPTATNMVWTRYDQVPLPIDWELAGWEVMDENDFVVRYDMDNERYYSWYDSDGNWIGTAYVVSDHKTLPASVTSTLNSNFGSYTITSVNKEFWKDRTAYEIELKSGDSKVKLLVDGNGNIIKQKTR